MKHFYYVKLCILLLLGALPAMASLTSKSAVVYYGKQLSYPMVGVHDYIIVDPDQTEVHTTGFKTYRHKMYAYVSINELHPQRHYAKQVKDRWIIGSNEAWQSDILNIADKSYQNFLLNTVIKKLHNKGFKNFFFDTLDSYQLAPVSEGEKETLKKGVIHFIKRFKKRYPHAKLIVNRGFEMMDEIHPFIDAVLFESYYYGIDATTMTYKTVSDADRNWLDTQLDKIHAYHLPIIALDYMPMAEREQREANVIALQERGFIPYVAQKELTDYGISSKQAFKREVLLLFNGQHLEDNNQALTNVHLFASMPLEYEGYVPRRIDVNKPLPYTDLQNRYAGIVVWLDREIGDYTALLTWADYAMKQNVKVLFLGDASIKFTQKIVQSWGLHTTHNSASKQSPTHIVHKDKQFGFETPLSISYHDTLIDTDAQSIMMAYENDQGQRSTIAALMPWGGYILDDALMSTYGEYTLWIANPFILFKEALGLETMPAPDPTTENGKRLMFLHVDGDGSMNRVESNPKEFSIQRLLKNFISKYPFPQSISIVESETAPYGNYPKLSAALEEAARKIYSYDYIEGATHTYSHPYNWKGIELHPGNQHYRNKLTIPYSFSAKREFQGSLSYINQQLIPDNRPKTRTIFWSGDCSPSANIVAYTYKHHYQNINGGDTFITNDRPWHALVQPLGKQLGEYYQVYTGQQNENIYTNNWLGPFWAFKKVIQTFKLTESPRRLKPIDVYFHFYSASKTASEVALKEIYEWVLTQDIMHIFTSEYPAKVTDFYDASLSKQGNAWLLCGFNNLRTVRIPTRFGIPRVKSSRGIVGYNKAHKNYYIHLSNKRKKILTLVNYKSKESRLISANARLISQKGKTQHFKGYMPISLRYKEKSGCTLSTTPESTLQSVDGEVTITFDTAKDVYVTQTCR